MADRSGFVAWPGPGVHGTGDDAWLSDAMLPIVWQVVILMRDNPVVRRFVLQQIQREDAAVQAFEADLPTFEQVYRLNQELDDMRNREAALLDENSGLKAQVLALTSKLENTRRQHSETPNTESSSDHIDTARVVPQKRQSPESTLSSSGIDELESPPPSGLPVPSYTGVQSPHNNSFTSAISSVRTPLRHEQASAIRELNPEAGSDDAPFTSFTNTAGAPLELEDLAEWQLPASPIVWLERSSTSPEPASSSPPPPHLPTQEPKDKPKVAARALPSPPHTVMDVDVDMDADEDADGDTDGDTEMGVGADVDVDLELELELSSGRSSPRDEFGLPLPRYVFVPEVRVVRRIIPSVLPLTAAERNHVFEEPPLVMASSSH